MSSNIKEIAVEYATKIWDQKDIRVIDRLVHHDVLIHSPLGDFRGTSSLKEVAQVWLKGFPDLSVSNEIVISENDIVSILWKAKGTHLGEFKGRQPTGRAISYSGVTVYRIQNSQITEYWACLDMLHVLSQIEPNT